MVHAYRQIKITEESHYRGMGPRLDTPDLHLTIEEQYPNGDYCMLWWRNAPTFVPGSFDAGYDAGYDQGYSEGFDDAEHDADVRQAERVIEFLNQAEGFDQ
jgi:hypothetical protein